MNSLEDPCKTGDIVVVNRPGVLRGNDDVGSKFGTFVSMHRNHKST